MRSTSTLNPPDARANSSGRLLILSLKKELTPITRGWFVVLAEADLAASMRRAGQEGDAKRLVIQMNAYASELVARGPDDVFAHLALSAAYVQVAKNAYRDEKEQPEPALRQAVNSAERALAISPGNAKAQTAVADCRRRLEMLRSGLGG